MSFNYFIYLCTGIKSMTFEKIIEDGRLWAVIYEGETQNALDKLFDQWNDVMWLRKFFKENIRYLLDENIIDDEGFIEYVNTL